MYVKCEHSQNYFKKTECKVPSKTKSCQNTDKKSVSSTSNQRSRPFTAVNKQNSSQQSNRFAPLSTLQPDPDINTISSANEKCTMTRHRNKNTIPLRVRPKVRQKFVLWDDLSDSRSDSSDTSVESILREWDTDSKCCQSNPCCKKVNKNYNKRQTSHKSHKASQSTSKKKTPPPIDWDKIRRETSNNKQTQTNEEQSQGVDQPKAKNDNNQPRMYNQLVREEAHYNAKRDPLKFETLDNKIQVLIQGTLYEGLLDTGADLCSITEEIVRQNSQLRSLPKYNTKVQSAISACEDSPVLFNYVIYPTVEVGTFRVTLPFYVSDNCTSSVILGVPFMRRTKVHLDFGPDSCTVTFNNIVLTDNTVVVPANSTINVSSSPKAPNVPHGPMLISTNLANRYGSDLIPQDIAVTVSKHERSPVFKIPVTNTTARDIEIPANIRIGYMIFTVVYDRFDNPSGDRFRLDRLTADNIQNTGLARALHSLRNPNKTPRQFADDTDKTSNQETPASESYAPVEHDLSGASHLLPDQLAQLKALLLEYDDVFLHSGQKLSCTDVIEQHLNIPKDTKPWPCRPLRMNNTRLAILHECVKDLLQQGIVESCESPYNNGIVLVRKSNGSNRLCLDCRSLNENITPIPVNPRPMQDILASITPQAKFYSVFDFTSAYFQIPLAKEDRKYTAFQTGHGQFCFRRSVMGCNISSSTLVTAINKLFQDMLHKEISFYLDDGLCVTKTFDEHLDILRKVFQRLRKAKLMLGHKKCHWLQTSATFLGHTISEEGIKPAVDKTDAIAKFAIPKTVKDVKSVFIFQKICTKF